MRLRARELVQLDAKQEALQRIDSWVPEPPQPSDAGRLLQAARLLEELKFFPAAEEKFTAFDKLTSGKTLVLAGFQARQGRINEAFQLVADRATNDNVKSISGAAMFVMSQLPAKVTDVQFQQAENWVQLAMAQDPADLSLTLNWSSTLELLGKTQLAEKILSDALNANLTRQQRGAVLNNLAYLRAVHGATDIDTQRLVDEAEKLVGPHPMIMDSRAMIHLAQSQCSLAVDQLKEALSFGDESGIYHFHLALAYQCTSDRSAVFQALEDAERMEFSVPKLSVYEQQRYRELQSWLTR
ncbi:MAG: hypothetical protein GTO53_11785 [Planctomycetales bacterium]|nr:hypothetical protein [Planctomycetales bacterium]NIM09792.1 hypothetical protein [Planctomycetales bacterium]NIN09261.1 hypothetical protein [Planctomycetales bacterium]NIN78361.1 hypothetical protein [Planctomycetales bacterium]NIO35540.1 hypothetical protein [Planctomycetales bacterium]